MRAPFGEIDRAMEDERERIAELRHPRTRPAGDHRRHVEGGADAACAAAGDENLLHPWEVRERPAQRGMGVLPTALLDDDRAVPHPPVADVHVARAGGDVDPAPTPKRVARLREVEHTSGVGRDRRSGRRRRRTTRCRGRTCARRSSRRRPRRRGRAASGRGRVSRTHTRRPARMPSCRPARRGSTPDRRTLQQHHHSQRERQARRGPRTASPLQPSRCARAGR